MREIPKKAWLERDTSHEKRRAGFTIQGSEVHISTGPSIANYPSGPDEHIFEAWNGAAGSWQFDADVYDTCSKCQQRLIAGLERFECRCPMQGTLVVRFPNQEV